MFTTWKETFHLWAEKFLQLTLENPESYKIYFVIGSIVAIVIFLLIIRRNANPTSSLIISGAIFIASPFLFTFVSILIFATIKHMLYCIPTILIIIIGMLVIRWVKGKKGLDN